MRLDIDVVDFPKLIERQRSKSRQRFADKPIERELRSARSGPNPLSRFGRPKAADGPAHALGEVRPLLVVR